MSDEQILRLFTGGVVLTKSGRHVSISASTDAKALEIFDCLTEINRQAPPSLLPCPFCGGKGVVVEDAYVECVDCTAYGPSTPEGAGDRRRLAIEAWNRRAKS